jgi:hypothetical protein
MPTKRKLWEILVPRADNSGRQFATRKHNIWDARVRAVAGGLTKLPVVRGQWVGDDGKVYAERMTPVRVVASEREIRDLADFTAEHYSQLAVMYAEVSDNVKIHNRKG